MNIVFNNNNKRNKCFLINADECVPTAIFPRRPSFLFRQTVRTFTLEHLISYTVGLGFLFVFFILLTARFRGMFRGYSGVFRDAPLFPTMTTPPQKALSLKGAVVERFDSRTKPFPVSGKSNLRSGGPSSP